ncbi:MAG: ISAzo13 family transposase, partial [Trueperaceae bacterium]|nr:ISAzo13 family transposase [Trueperaceae bacterium]
MDVESLRAKYRMLSGRLDERSLRLCLASDAMALGRGGITRVAEAAGVSRTTVYAGVRELKAPALERGAARAAGEGKARIR